MNEYPLTLYRAGSEFSWDGIGTDMLIVTSEDEHLTALEKGWKVSADYLSPNEVLSEKPRRGRPPKENTDG